MALDQGPYYKALGANIRAKRIQMAMTQAQLAIAVGLTRTSVTNIETGRQPVYVHILARLAHNLSTSLESLLPTLTTTDVELESHLEGLSDLHKEWIARVIAQGSS